jgi:hypothetical protein
MPLPWWRSDEPTSRKLRCQLWRNYAFNVDQHNIENECCESWRSTLRGNEVTAADGFQSCVLIGISELYFRTKLLPLQGALTSMATCFTLCSQAFDRCVTSNTPSTSIRGHADPLSRALSQNGYGQNMKVIGRPLWDPIFLYIYIYIYIYIQWR